ncbi:MAG: Rieske 2Fe-2S domain-containing protein [Betaproteobacteria bacterium]|nr:Rieske 2Fe-2S domain-containing protein [Betaproteobacteria bacterium]
MYPLKNGQLWPRNQWYVAGWSNEFDEAPIERTILGERLLLFRGESGRATVLAGLCPHRFMPLVKGARSGDRIECAYHGMTFDGDGVCTKGPAGAPPGGATRIKRYATLEQGPLVWVWMGQADAADPAKMPDTSRCGIATDGWRADPNGTMHFAARYMLMVDNLFDLSHIAWVHVSLLGKPTLCDQPVAVSREGCILRADRHETGPVDDFSRYLFPESVGPIQQTLGTELLGPGLITAVGPWVREAEGSPLVGKDWGQVQFVHVITPETATTTNVFSLVSRNFRLEDEGLTAALCAQNKAVLAQDCEVAGLIEAGLNEADTMSELSFRPDHGAIEARRYIQSLIDAEKAQ